MKRALKIIGILAALIVVAVAGLAIAVYSTALSPRRAVGFQQIAVADPGHAPFHAAVWYPSSGRPGFLLLGTSGAKLASDGPVEGNGLPLVVISHGTGGSALSHADTAIALAERGFVVIAPTHPGDNLRDSSDVGKPDWLVNRARHMQRTIDAALTSWKDRGHLDPGRIGIFGFSAGATTALIDVGGKPDLRQIWNHCSTHPEFVCRLTSPEAYKNLGQLGWRRDDRIRAAVLAAPGLGFTFAPDGLAEVKVPVQLWAGSADTIVPFTTNTGLVGKLLGSRAEVHLVPGAVHYSFLAPCGLLGPRQFCKDPGGFDRALFHRQLNAAAARFFTEHLGPPTAAKR